MAAAVLHDLHTCRHVTLAQTEREAIASSPTPINVFWINLINIHDPIKWPQNRQYTAFSKKTTTGVFVTYQSDQTPLSSFGVCGDLWVTSDRLFIKETDGSWTVWNRGVQFRFPFDQSRRLVWSHNAHFKYLGDETVRTEALRWKRRGSIF
ncbi:hypothetical protein BDY19DRAFT_342651 [Irpex rosettiformis]|uniref:Uncharacterized protein n=1 Tax=Irpex rosettiformis TaxID=378272 RepID=A0ACB8TXJ0_9APHY|nr:hypothetical protein BDY19DRAFT_342651 [Irpex rosettiformis]